MAFLLGLSAVYFWFDRNLLSPLEPESETSVVFEIKEGWNLKTISEGLEEAGLIRRWWSVYYLSRLKDDENKLSITAGEYALSPDKTPQQILDILLSGETVQHKLVLPAGITVRQAAKLIGDADLVSEYQAFEALRDQQIMTRLGIPAYVPEGYLLEGRYSFRKPITAAQVVAKIATESKERLDQELEGWKSRASEIGFLPYEILVIASILEKESESITERKILSSLYHNRLRIGMPLQSDAVLRYNLAEDHGEITQEDISSPSPYNLYLNTGLPPTPICTPSIASIDAALYPDDTDFLYFLRRRDGSLDYSATFKEHEAKRKSEQEEIRAQQQRVLELNAEDDEIIEAD